MTHTEYKKKHKKKCKSNFHRPKIKKSKRSNFKSSWILKEQGNKKYTYFCADLVPALSGLEMHYFPHFVNLNILFIKTKLIWIIIFSNQHSIPVQPSLIRTARVEWNKETVAGERTRTVAARGAFVCCVRPFYPILGRLTQLWIMQKVNDIHSFIIIVYIFIITHIMIKINCIIKLLK